MQVSILDGGQHLHKRFHPMGNRNLPASLLYHFLLNLRFCVTFFIWISDYDKFHRQFNHIFTGNINFNPCITFYLVLLFVKFDLDVLSAIKKNTWGLDRNNTKRGGFHFYFYFYFFRILFIILISPYFSIFFSHFFFIFPFLNRLFSSLMHSFLINYSTFINNNSFYVFTSFISFHLFPETFSFFFLFHLLG